MDQKSLAERLAIKASTISDYKAGRSFPSADVLVHMAENFGVSLDWLLLGKESDPADDMARMIRKLPEDQQRLLKSQVEGWLAMARQDTRESSG